jgi:hypothetical protein
MHRLLLLFLLLAWHHDGRADDADEGIDHP